METYTVQQLDSVKLSVCMLMIYHKGHIKAFPPCSSALQCIRFFGGCHHPDFTSNISDMFGIIWVIPVECASSSGSVRLDLWCHIITLSRRFGTSQAPWSDFSSHCRSGWFRLFTGSLFVLSYLRCTSLRIKASKWNCKLHIDESVVYMLENRKYYVKKADHCFPNLFQIFGLFPKKLECFPIPDIVSLSSQKKTNHIHI